MNKIINYFLIPSIFFITDLTIYTLCYYPALSLVRLIFYFQLLNCPKLFFLIPSSCFILAESFIYNGYCGIDLVIMIPIYFIAKTLDTKMALGLFEKSILTIFSLIVHYLAIDYIIFKRPLNCILNLKIIGIYCIVVLLLGYLKFTDSRGNRLK